MERRRALLAASQMGGDNNIITLSPYPEMSIEEGLALVEFFTLKYGVPYGTRRNPLPIDEVVYASGFRSISEAMVNSIQIDENGNVMFRNDTVWGYYSVRITPAGYCSEYFWD